MMCFPVESILGALANFTASVVVSKGRNRFIIPKLFSRCLSGFQLPNIYGNRPGRYDPLCSVWRRKYHGIAIKKNRQAAIVLLTIGKFF